MPYSFCMSNSNFALHGNPVITKSFQNYGKAIAMVQIRYNRVSVHFEYECI